MLDLGHHASYLTFTKSFQKNEQSLMADSNSHSAIRPRLRYSTRFLFATIIPTICSTAGVLCIWGLWLRHTEVYRDTFSIFSANGPDSGGAGGFVFLVLAIGAVAVAIFIVLPALLCGFCITFIPWKKWYAALIWGFVAQASGIVLVICLHALTSFL